MKRGSKIELVKIVLELIAQVFYTFTSYLLDGLYWVVSKAVLTIAVHNEVLHSILPDSVIDWCTHINDSLDEKKQAFEKVNTIFDETFSNEKPNEEEVTVTEDNSVCDDTSCEINTEEDVQKESSVEIEKTSAEQVKECLRDEVGNVINISIGTINIGSIENMWSLIGTLKSIGAEVKKVSVDDMDVDEMIKLKNELDERIKNVNKNEMGG